MASVATQRPEADSGITSDVRTLSDEKKAAIRSDALSV
jgi:hypothetical protein